jgi:hypothetical protein
MRQVHSSAAFTLAIILLGVRASPQSVPSSRVSANDLARRVITNELKFQDDHTNWMYRLEKETPSSRAMVIKPILAEEIGENPRCSGNREGLGGFAPIRMIVGIRKNQRYPHE